MKRIIKLLVFCLVILSTITILFAQEEKQITIEWINSEEGGQITAVPRFQWLDDGTAMLMDMRLTKEKRTFEIYDPANGKKHPAVDRKKILEALKSVDTSATSLSWPSAFSNDGKRALYVFGGDVYLLELEKPVMIRVTGTDAEEKCARISPDGSKVSYVRENDLYVYEIASKTEQQLTFDGSDTLLNGTLSWVYWEEIFGRNDLGYWWSGDSRSIAYLQTDESPVSMMHYVHYEPAIPKVIKQRYPKTGTDNPKVKVGIVGISDPKTTWVEVDEGAYEYVCRVQWLPDDSRVSIQTMNRMQDTLNLYIADPVSGEASLIMQESDEGWVNVHDDLHFLEDGKHFIWLSERDGYAHLYRYAMDGTLVNRITKGEWSLRSSGGGVYWLNQAVAAVDEEAGYIYFTALEKSSIERHLYRIRLDGSGMERISKGDGVHRISFSPDAKYYFDNYSSVRIPPALSLHRADGDLAHILAAPRTDLVEVYGFQFPEQFTIPATDGFLMPAEILKPADFDSRKQYPVIMHVYGGPSAPTVVNAWSRSRYFDQVLIRNGYLVVRCDHRASTGISKWLENLLTKKFIGAMEISDISDGVRWFKEKPYTDANRFGVWGWSGGGSYTLHAMTGTKEFKAGVAVAAVTDWHYYDTKFGETAMKTPQSNPEGYESTSIVKKAKDLHGRLMLVHGTYDDNVHPQNAWAFMEELIQANIQFDMMFYPMRKHGIADRPARIHLYNTMLRFWRENL